MLAIQPKNIIGTSNNFSTDVSSFLLSDINCCFIQNYYATHSIICANIGLEVRLEAVFFCKCFHYFNCLASFSRLSHANVGLGARE